MVEVVVTLSITFIVLFMISTLSISISDVVKLQNINSKSLAEYYSIKQNIQSFFTCYSIKGYEIKETNNLDNQSNVIISNSIDDYGLIFNQENKQLSYEILNFQSQDVDIIVENYETINDVVFELNDNIVKCKINLINETVYVFLVKLEV